VAEAVRAVAAERGVQPASVAVAWLRDRPTVAAPIAGATRLDQVLPLLEAATLELDESERQQLERVSDAFQPV
jgi:aryl-alcohol dehydrogenase-like predicted oxidoreductase